MSLRLFLQIFFCDRLPVVSSWFSSDEAGKGRPGEHSVPISYFLNRIPSETLFLLRKDIVASDWFDVSRRTEGR